MNPSLFTATVLAILALSSPARAAAITNSPTAPAIGADDIANYGSVTGTDKWFYENSAAGAAKGQTFTTGNAAVLLKAITYQIAAGAGAAPTKTYAIRVGTVAGSTPTFSPITSETASQTVAWAAGDYVTWTFATPVLLQSNTAYGIDVGMTGSTSGWQTGIPYLNVTGNEYPGGALYNSGTSGAGTTAMSLGTNDRLFHIDLEKPITPAFTLVATNPADGAANMLASSPLLATFSRYLTSGTGNITLRNLTDSVDTVIPVGDPRISLFENLLTIVPGSALNWGKSYAVRIDPGALVSDTAIPFAGISDDTTWNFGTAPGDPLLDAIAALKSHITGTITLSAAQITAHKLTIDAERNRFATSADAIAAAFDLVTTFDTVKGPLWVTQSLPQRSAVTNDNLNWVIFTVMQYLMDLTYNATNIANHQSLLNGFKFGSTANFPGPCAPPADPNLTHTATISASYLNTVGRATQGDGPGTFARKPTGCYLAPGSIATVTVPPALVGAGYLIRVGAHSWDHSNRPNIKRLDRATLVYSIDALETKIASPLGGGIYIEVPFLANAGVVSVQIKNAVRSPFFSAKSFHTTTPAQWLTERANPAPWADFQSEKFMMQVPTNWISSMPDPTQLMADWDTAMDAVNDLMGFPRIRGKEAFYTQVDVQLRASVFAPGYPSCNVGGFNASGNYGGYNNHYLVRGPQNGIDANIEFHEQGHGYFFPKFGGESESNVNLLYVPAMQALGMSLDQAFRQSVTSGNTYQTLDTTAMAWMCCFNFSPKEQPMEGLEKQYQLKGHAKFVDIARLFGWSGLNAYWASFTQNEENGVPPPSDTDGMLLRLCQSVGKDIRPLFHFWGVHPQNPTTLAANIAAAGIPASTEIRDRLLYYKTLVPANNAAFRTFAMSWWGHKPLITGYWEETDHAMQWDETPDADGGSANANVRPNGDIYVEASAADIQGRVQELVDLYYPNAIPPTLVTLSPADSATDVALSSNLTATFSESIAAGTGNITLKNLTDGTQSVIAVTDTTRVSFAGSVLTINPTTDFLANKSYAIRIDAGAVKDLSNTSFAGITDDTTWNFTSTTPDLTPPTPDPLTWANVPQATSQSAIVMTATTATDISGVEYFFECTAGGGHSSAWQSSATYTDTGLSSNTTYTYRVQARDKSPANNTTGFSATASATTAQMGAFSSGTTAPVVDGADIANLGTQTSNDKWFFQTADESDPWDWAKGQTFTTGASAVLLKALTYKIDPANKKAASTTYTVRVGTLSGTNFTAIARAVCTQTVDTAVGAYMTWTFGTPVALASNTTYGIDVAMVSAVAYTTGIPYLACTGNAYAGGQYYNSGPTGGSGSGPTISANSSLDRVFHLDLDAADATPPTLTSSAIADDKSGGPVTVNTLVTYTVTFSEDMDATTVSAADFGNAGDAAVTIGTVSETTPGVFTVPVTPTGAGSLQLKVNAGAVLKDVAGNALVTASAIVDNTTLTVDGTPPVLTSSAIADDKSGGPITVSTLVTYTVTFSEDMDASTVSAADFGNAGSATVTIGTVSETTPGVFTVPVTPTSAGTLQLKVIAGVVLKDVAGNALVTTLAIADDTTLTVDGTPPVLTSSGMVDDKGGGPITVSTLVIYTVTFSEDMDASTVSAADFGNAGSATVTIGTVSETTPGVFTVPVTPTSAGTLQLKVIAGVVLKDVAGNALVTTLAIADDTTLTVDGTPPALTSSGMVDDKGGGPITVNTLVTYTVTFSEDMDATTVSAADFGNAGDAAVTIGTVSETTPGVFTVPVTPTGAGSLQLKVIAGAVLKDVAGNALVTASAIVDNTTLTVDGTPPVLTSSAIADDKSGGPITVSTLVIYTVTFSEDMDASTVSAADFGNAGSATVTIGTVSETTPGVFTVPVTPTSAGTLQLKVIAGVVLKDVAGNALVTTLAIADDTTLTVDGTPPALTSSGMVDDKGGGPITVNTLVTYTVTFSEDMDATTVSAADFGNAGSATVTIGTVSETTPGVFTVPVTPTSAGTLQLKVIAGVVLKDVAGNALVTASAIVDNTTLTVDGTPPVLTSSAIADDKSGGPITVSTLVIYTVTFSEDMDASTVSAADFGNAGSATVTIGTVSETTPGVFTVPVTPTSAGTLQLKVIAGVVLKDVAGNALVTTLAIADDTTLTVDGTPPALTSSGMVDDKGGGPITVNTLVTYTVTFSEDMDATTVSAADFGNAGSATVTIGTVSETTPGVFTVPVTPTSAGTLQLKVIAGVVLKDVAGNALVTTSAIADDMTITVIADYATWAGGAAFDADSNNDGVGNGLAWLLGAADPSANATALLPKPAHESGKLVLTFRCLKTAQRGAVVLKVQYTNDLGQADPWTSHEAVVPDADGTVGSVVFDTTPDADPAFIHVRTEIPATAAAPAGRLFARLHATGY